MSSRLRGIGLLIVFGIAPLNANQPQTVCDVARQGGGIMSGVGSGWPGSPFRVIVGRADLVIEGTVMRHRAYVTPDQQRIFTDYEFSVSRMIFQRQVSSTTKPGAASPYIFTAPGGTVSCDGIPVSETGVSSNGRYVRLKDGDHVVIVGRQSADGKWYFDPWGVFYFTGNSIVNDLPVLEEDDDRLPPVVPLEEFAARIRVAATQR